MHSTQLTNVVTNCYVAAAHNQRISDGINAHSNYVWQNLNWIAKACSFGVFGEDSDHETNQNKILAHQLSSELCQAAINGEEIDGNYQFDVTVRGTGNETTIRYCLSLQFGKWALMAPGSPASKPICLEGINTIEQFREAIFRSYLLENFNEPNLVLEGFNLDYSKIDISKLHPNKAAALFLVRKGADFTQTFRRYLESQRSLPRNAHQTTAQIDINGFNLEDRELSDFDLTGIDFRNISLVGTNLQGARYIASELHHAVIDFADYAGQITSELKVTSILTMQNTHVASVTDIDKKRLEQANINVNDDKIIIFKHFMARRSVSGQLERGNLANLINTLNEAGWFCALDFERSSFKYDNHNLSNLNLQGAILDNGSLEGAKLENSNLESAHLSYANMSRAKLCGANMKKVKGNRLNLNGAELRDTQLDGAVLIVGDLRGADLTGAKMRGTVLTRTDMRGATLNHVDILGAGFYDSQFDTDQIFTLFLPEWNTNNLTDWFNNPFGRRSIVETINEIDDKYVAMKLNMLHQVIDSLADQGDLLQIQDTLLWHLTRNDHFLRDEKIATFITTRLLGAQIGAAKTSKLAINRYQLNAQLRTVKYMPTSDQRAMMLNHNAYFIQLIALSLKIAPFVGNERTAKELYDIYWSLPELASLKAEFNHLYLETQLDQDDLFLIFYNALNNSALALTPQNVEEMLDGTANDWTSVYYFENGENKPVISGTDLYNQFTLFKTQYELAAKKGAFNRLLKAINLNFQNPTNKPDLEARDYRPLFDQALSATSSATKLIEVEDQLILDEIFAPLMKKSALPGDLFPDCNTLDDIHFQILLGIFGLTEADNLSKARHLVCLARLITILSSRNYFGDEMNSPFALRAYAAALLKKAYELDPSVYSETVNSADSYKPARTSEQVFREWMSTLLSIPDADGKIPFGCTDQLSQEILRHINHIPELKEIMQAIKPASW